MSNYMVARVTFTDFMFSSRSLSIIFRMEKFKDLKGPNRLRETMPYKNVIAIDFVEDLITMNWQGNDLILNIDDCNIQE